MIPPDDEDLQPSFDCRRPHMLNVFANEDVRRFYLSKDTFNSIPTSVATHPKSESEPRQCSFEMVGIIDQNRCLGDRYNLLKLS